MTCIEVIRIRLASTNVERFKSTIEQLTGEFKLMDPQVYQHASIRSEFSISFEYKWWRSRGWLRTKSFQDLAKLEAPTDFDTRRRLLLIES
jgi:hypothetical protein